MAILQHAAQCGGRTGNLAALHEIGEQATGGVVDRGNHGQLAQRLHGSILVDIDVDVFHLLLVEEGQTEQLLACGGVDVHGFLLHVAQRLILVFPVIGIDVVGCHQFHQHALPGTLLGGSLLCVDVQHGEDEEGEGNPALAIHINLK